VAALCLALPAQAAMVQETNQFVIELAGGGPADLAATVEAAGGTLVSDLPEIGYATAVSDDPKFARKVAKARGIGKVHRDLMVQWTPALEDAVAETVAVPTELSNGVDPTTAYFYSCQWNMTQIDAPGAWAKGYFGDPGVKVAVLDSGIDPFHSDLAGRVDTAQSVSVLTPGTSPCNALFGLPDEETYYDFRFHGTFVASQIVSNGLGMAGVTRDAQVVAVKTNHCGGSGSFGDLITGIVYASSLPDVDVLNMSLGAYFNKNLPGGGQLLAAVTKAVNYAGSMGKLVVSSAGNNGADLQHDGNAVHLPSEAGSGLGIYATNVNDQLASYSNYGANATWVGAPGGDGVDPDPPLPGCPVSPASQGGVIGVCSQFSIFFGCGPASYLVGGGGTSFSAPIAAGVAALVDGKYGGALNAGQLKTMLSQSADDLGKVGTDNLYSHGRVNAGQAVDY
jgi:subtilisin family serine protease